MSSAIQVESGIFIDYRCSGVVRIDKGYFIPTGYQTDETAEPFNADLQAFLGKWFPQATACNGGEKTISSCP